MHQIYRRTPKRKCDFNKVAKQLREGYSPANLLHNFRTTFLENNSGWLLLDYHSESNSKKENKKYEENKKMNMVRKPKTVKTIYQLKKMTVYILGDSMIKKLNGFLRKKG